MAMNTIRIGMGVVVVAGCECGQKEIQCYTTVIFLLANLLKRSVVVHHVLQNVPSEREGHRVKKKSEKEIHNKLITINSSFTGWILQAYVYKLRKTATR